MHIHIYMHINNCNTEAKNPSLVACLFSHILHWICFKILFTESKYLVSNWSYKTRLIWTIKKVKKWLKSLWFFIIIRNHCFIILKLFCNITGFILDQIKQTALKSGYNFTTYGKFTDTSWIEELQTRKHLSLIWAFNSISRKRQATVFEPFCHIYIHILHSQYCFS